MLDLQRKYAEAVTALAQKTSHELHARAHAVIDAAVNAAIAEALDAAMNVVIDATEDIRERLHGAVDMAALAAAEPTQ